MKRMHYMLSRICMYTPCNASGLTRDDMTEDVAKVTCRSCLRSLGRTPMRSLRSTFRFVRVEADRVFIEDLCEGKTVTNDAENVTKAVGEQYPGRRIIYKDTLGSWDELLHSHGTFQGFAPYREHHP